MGSHKESKTRRRMTHHLQQLSKNTVGATVSTTHMEAKTATTNAPIRKTMQH
jgi:hypothetical protein